MTNATSDATLAPIVVGLVSVAQKVGMPSKFSPLLAAAVGAAVGIFYPGFNGGNKVQGAINGILSGLAAVGFNSIITKTPQAVKSLKKTKASSSTTAVVTDTPPTA